MTINLYITSEHMKNLLNGKSIRVEFDTVKKYACGEPVEINIEAEHEP